jgi:Glycosyltransferase family 87
MRESALSRVQRGRRSVRLRALAVARVQLHVRPWFVYPVVALWGLLYVSLAFNKAAGFDSHAYWLTREGVHYLQDPGEHDAYLYSPAFAHAIRPLTVLPWPAFAFIWATLATMTYVWFVRRAEPRWRVPVFALCLGDLVYGNVWWLFAITLAFGLRRPALWAIPALIKITPAVGLIWFVVRREWRNLAIVVTVVSVVAAISFLLAPQAWADWVAFLHHGHHEWFPDKPLPLAGRLAAAFGLTVYAARNDRPRLLPAALWLASPMFSINGIAVFIVLAFIGSGSRDNPVVEPA